MPRLPPLRGSLRLLPTRPLIRRLSTPPPNTPTPLESRISRLPARLQPYARRFTSQPLSHLTAFLILHELTAVIPLAGLASLFHVTEWSPVALIPEEGREKAMGWWEGYLKRKGWDKWLGVEGDGEGNIGGHGRLVVEIVTAAAIVKMLMPVRLAASAWMAPGAVRVFWRVFGRGEKAVKP